MAEAGSERENGGLASMDSTESRWVYQDEESSDIDNDGDDSPQRDSDDDDNVEQRLIRTGPRIDSFDVEALEVPGAHRNEFEDAWLDSVDVYQKYTEKTSIPTSNDDKPRDLTTGELAEINMWIADVLEPGETMCMMKSKNAFNVKLRVT